MSENINNDKYTPPTLEEIEQLSKRGKIKSLKPFYIEFDFRDDEDMTTERIERYNELTQNLFSVIDKVTDKYPELLTIPEGADIEAPETFIDFFTRLISLSEKNETSKTNALVMFPDKTALFVPTLKKYLGALMPKKNKTAYIAKSDKQLQFIWDENGEYTIDVADEQTTFEEISKSKALSAKDTDTDLLMTLASAVEAAYLSSCGYIITVYLPNFAQAMGVRFENDGADKDQKQYDFKKKLSDLENTIGVLVEQKKIKAAFKILEIDQAKKTLTFASPYLYSLMEIFERERIKSTQKKNNTPVYDIKGVSHLVDAKINTARSKATTQIVYYVLARVHERGSKTDAARKPGKEFEDTRKRTVFISYKEIIKDVPLIAEIWEDNKKHRAQLLDRAIFGKDYNHNIKRVQTPIIEEYLKKYTNAYKYWKGVSIKLDKVTSKDLTAGITFTHQGINGDFENDLQLPVIVPQDTNDES